MTVEQPITDANATETFVSARLDWAEGETAKGQRHLALVGHLLELRRSVIAPLLAGTSGNSGSYEVHAEQALRVRWRLGDGSHLTLIANLSPRPTGEGDRLLPGECLYAQPAHSSGAGRLQHLPPWP